MVCPVPLGPVYLCTTIHTVYPVCKGSKRPSVWPTVNVCSPSREWGKAVRGSRETRTRCSPGRGGKSSTTSTHEPSSVGIHCRPVASTKRASSHIGIRRVPQVSAGQCHDTEPPGRVRAVPHLPHVGVSSMPSSATGKVSGEETGAGKLSSRAVLLVVLGASCMVCLSVGV